jgi:hypothetical protein
MRAFLTLLCVVFVSATLAAEPGGKTLTFPDEAYELAFTQEVQGEVLNEYVLRGETLDDWTRLLSVHVYPRRVDFQLLAGSLVKVVKEKNPLAQAALHTSQDGRRSMVDFLTWAGTGDETITEFNVFIYQLGPDGKSVLAQQYAERAYGREEGLDYMRQLKGRRIKMLEAVGQFKFPAPTKDQPAAE